MIAPRVGQVNDDQDAGQNQGVDRAPKKSSGTAEWGTLLRNVLLVLVLLGFIWLVFNVRMPSVDGLRGTLDGWGWAAWLGFIGLYAVVALTPLPVSVMAITAGLFFGTIGGSALSVIGVLIGCWGAYWLARALGESPVKKLLGRHANTVEEHLGNAGFQAVYLLRLMPGLPYWPVNYGSGAFGVSQRDFLVASAAASIPGQVSLVAVGSFVARPSLLKGIVVAIAWAVVILMTIWAYRSWKGIAKRPLPGGRLRER